MKAEENNGLTPGELQSLYELPCEVEAQPRVQVSEAPPSEAPQKNIYRSPSVIEFEKGQQELQKIMDALPAAILSLRKKLGRSQWTMTLLLGCGPGSYKRWEKGRSVPPGNIVIRMLNLCPDNESVRMFGLDFKIMNR